MPSSEITPPMTTSTPATIMPAPNAATEASTIAGDPPDSGGTVSEPSSASKRAATTRPMTAIASSAATREIWLLIPLATPALCCGTAPRTVLVSGATVADRPSPNTITAGSRSVQ